jgi:hypothetical protein
LTLAISALRSTTSTRGIDPYPGGLFWTIRIPDDSVQVSPGSGNASMRLTNVVLADHHNIPNSLSGDPVPSDPATLTYLNIEWSGPGSRLTVTDNVNFIGKFVENVATLSCQAVVTGRSTFTTDNAPTTSVFAEVGHERNGVFFS